MNPPSTLARRLADAEIDRLDELLEALRMPCGSGRKYKRCHGMA